MRHYAIGDIHGQDGLLAAAHALIAEDRARTGDATAPVVHIGDLVDRGPTSAQVIARLIAGQAAGAPWIVLKGNHDLLFQRWLEDPFARHPMLRAEMSWTHPRVGGLTTLRSYGVMAEEDRPLAGLHAEARAAIPQAHRDWLAALPLSYAAGELFFAHAGVRPGRAFGEQVEDDLLWIRGDFLEDPREHGALVIHGHSHIDRATHYGNRLNLDSSAGYGGPVSAAVIEGRQAWLLTPEGRVLLG